MEISNYSSVPRHQTTFNLHEAAKFLGAHKETIRRMAATGKLPAAKIGKSWRFLEQDLVEYMRSQYIQPQKTETLDLSRNKDKWLLQNETAFGGLTSPTKEKEYAKALGLK